MIQSEVCILDLSINDFHFHLCERLLKKGREFVSQRENSWWTEGKSRSCRILSIWILLCWSWLLNFLSLLPLCSTAKASANVHRVMISCVSHLLVQNCTSANFENNSFAVNCFLYALFLMAISHTSYYYSYILKLSFYGFSYWMISVIIFRRLFKYRYLTDPSSP